MSELTPKQEKFAQKYVELGNASEAYRQSYDAANMKTETINRNASALLDNNKVATRIENLQSMHAERHEVTVDSITQELEEARMLAKVEKQPAPMITASMGKAKLYGLASEKQEIKVEMEVKVSPVDFARRAAFLFAKASQEMEKE